MKYPEIINAKGKKRIPAKEQLFDDEVSESSLNSFIDSDR